MTTVNTIPLTLRVATERGGLGLHIMSYRARSIGGDLNVAPRVGGGTLVRCRAPLPAQDASNGA